MSVQVVCMREEPLTREVGGQPNGIVLDEP